MSEEVIKWGRQSNHQRYKCKRCGVSFTLRRKDVSLNNMFVWFKWWIVGKQTIERGHHIKSTLFYRLTDKEREWEIIRGLQTLKALGVKIESVTSDGARDIIKAVRYVCPYATRQRCLVHIERECLSWITQFPKTSAGIALRRLVLRISGIAIMRAFVTMRNYIMTTHQVTAELAEIRARLEMLERNDEDNMAAVNDLSEDMRKEIDNIYQAIAELSVRPVASEKPRKKIGFKTNSDE